MRLSPAIQRREGLLNCAAWLTEMVTPDDPWSAPQRILRGKAALRRDGKAIIANPGLFTEGIHRHLVLRRDLPRKIDGLLLSCTVEQRPDPDSRITLSRRVDALGMPLSPVDWRVNEHEVHTVRRTAALVTAGLARLHARPPVLDDWVRNRESFPPSFRDVAHPTGTTRMSLDPAAGVVDEDCRVHGVRRLYVAGSSVFPPAGTRTRPR